MATIIGYDQSGYQDGLRALVTLSAPPVGALKFYARRTPGVPLDDSLQKTYVSGGPPHSYVVNVKTGAPGERATGHREAWYLTCSDNDGQGNEEIEWICAGENTSWFLQTDNALHDILLVNKPAFDRALVLALQNPLAPDGNALEVQEIHRGIPGGGQPNAFPRICHGTNSISEDHWGNPYSGVPYSDYIPMSGTVECYTLWQVDVDWGFAMIELGMAVFNVLNAPDYREIPLACAFRLFDCLTTAGSYSEECFDPASNAMIAAFSLQWQGKLHAGTCSPSQS